MPSKPMQRSLKHLTHAGWQCAIVERWKPRFDKVKGMIPYGVRVDVWGFGDILACRLVNSADSLLDAVNRTKVRVKEIALVQTTDATSFSKHKAKILAIPEFQKWKDAGGIVLLHGWAKRGPRGKRKTWTLREEVL